MALAVSGSDINPLAPSNQLQPRTQFSASQITTVIVKKQEEADVKIDSAEDSTTNNPPPTYSLPEASSSSSRPTVCPTNYTSISQRKSSIKGTWVIDPSLSMPSSTKHGKIEAYMTTVLSSVPDSVDEKGKRKKVVLHAKTSDGGVMLNLRPESISSGVNYTTTPPPFPLPAALSV
ncbi:hypothetical protein K443DRAFT_13872 [Laccaria amethystina LaAM-08-1]|uniref:DUF7330 domain-containing protein n=1 Tax=Laccaria amethystina LaAM-08-1 TaxID=1095629 RepID=A0A0C9X6Q2_9AGAR|nr:hypothetical protein K443DRAFT_13872 [Laccaria amethystina LaAM-08-1]